VNSLVSLNLFLEFLLPTEIFPYGDAQCKTRFKLNDNPMYHTLAIAANSAYCYANSIAETEYSKLNAPLLRIDTVGHARHAATEFD
jgi:hypothetical protein